MNIHAHTSPEALEVTNLTLETRTQSAQSKRVPVFRLRTTSPVNRAYLQQDRMGCLCLYFRGLPYGVDDYLPGSHFGSRAIVGATAGEFVCRQMLRDYGDHEDEWPALARQFLITHTSCQPDRSRSNW
jgi:hypothetical protein